MASPGALSERAVVLAPSGRDTALAVSILEKSGLTALGCPNLATLGSEVDHGAGLAVVADEALRGADMGLLTAFLNAQPPWSDFPIILLIQRGGGPERDPIAAQLAATLGNVTFLERPFHPTTLVSVVRTAIRGRQRQYQARALLEDLAEGQRQLQTALTAGSLGAYTLKIDPMHLRMSLTCKAHFGHAADQSMSYQDVIDSIHPSDRDRVREAVEHSVKTGEDFASEYRIHWPDQSMHWIDARARVLMDAAGRAEQMAGVTSDITARKNSELERERLLDELAQEREALSDLTATLEKRVQERTDALRTEIAARERAQEQLLQAQKMETIGQLTGGVAHDFNNLLAAVMGNLELLRKRVPDDPRLHRLIDGALQGARRGASLTQRMLAFARQQDLETSSADLGNLLAGMRDLLDRTLGPEVILSFDIPRELPPARVDANQLELAILNLAINARDAMPDGGIIHFALRLEQDATRAGIEPGDYLTIQIVDGGEGMDEATLKRAIEPFFSTKPVGKGTGLGLSMVHGLADQLGGMLDLTSVPGEGTTATLWLPVAAGIETAAVPKPDGAAQETHGRSAIILVVDDDPLICMSTAGMLEDLGHRVVEANSGKQALEILENGQAIDMMVTDLAMPGMNGVELTTLARKVRPNLPVLLATGYAELPSVKDSGLPRLTKPYEQADLKSHVDRLLQAR